MCSLDKLPSQTARTPLELEEGEVNEEKVQFPEIPAAGLPEPDHTPATDLEQAMDTEV